MRRGVNGPSDLAPLIGIPFSEQQLQAITAPPGPGVIVAGAGSGKTTVMATRVVWLVATGQLTADQVLGLTFTKKAAAELGDRVTQALVKAGLLRPPATPMSADEAAEPAEPTVLTYHAYAARLLTEHGLRIGHEPDTTLVADASRFQLAARAVRAHTRPISHLKTWVPTLVTGLLNLDAALSEHLVTVDQVRDFDTAELARWQGVRQTQQVERVVGAVRQRDELLGLVEEYRSIKQRLGVMDFSDQMALGARLAETCAEVGAAERQQFKVVLLDEYQDTSVAQARLLKGLFSGDDAGSGRGHPVTAVGDPCQAIYGWRGASVSNIERFGHDFPRRSGAPVRRYPLSVNRRSDTRILRAANDLAVELYDVHTGVQPLEPATGAVPGDIRAAVLQTYQDELDYLAVQVPAAHAAMARSSWSAIGVLVRDNKTASDVHDALTAAGVPVEVVGLNGLLRMPEVHHVVATLQVVQDMTANASLLSLLSGPRWAIGTRDLALLGHRARELARGPVERADDVTAKLEEAVAGIDPADVVSLPEALEDPGTGGFSPAALKRFAMLGSELRWLRGFVGEPLLDLVRRVIDTTGIDVELASSTSAVAAARRDNVAAFLDAVASFAGVDKDASLPGLLAYLEAEDEYGQGLSLALPSDADSVKLLTVHRAKGLEWDVVFLPGMCRKTFPSSLGRARWPTSMAELPSPLRGDRADLPQIREVGAAGLTAFVADSKAHELLEERRLGYVAITRPRHRLMVSAHWWGPQQKDPRGPSEFFDRITDTMAGWQAAPDPVAAAPGPDDVNPADRRDQPYPWPVDAGADEVQRRKAGAALVDAAAVLGARQAVERADDSLLLDERAVVQQWDRELASLVEEARAGQLDAVTVQLPAALSATTVLRLRDDPDGLARDLARPMPRRPSPASRFGTRFHAWVETHLGQQQLVEADDLPGRADGDAGGDEELRRLVETFLAGPFGTRTPIEVEAPFTVVLAGQIVRGRIDAIYGDGDGFLVVDWKTNRHQDADPVQLALYRLAWSELHGVEPGLVRGAFYYVRTGAVVYPELPGRADLERLVTGPDDASGSSVREGA